MISIQQRIATELGAGVAQIAAAVELLDGGATVPFVARYRKEVTGGLDDIQLRALEQRLGYLRELEERRETILKSIAEQGKLSDALAAQIREADSKARLEDLYLPYKQKRRTKGQIAREAGIEPPAELPPRETPPDPAQEAPTHICLFYTPEAAAEGSSVELRVVPFIIKRQKKDNVHGATGTSTSK